MEVEDITAVRVCDPLKVHQASGREGAQEELVPLMGGWRAPLRGGEGREGETGVVIFTRYILTELSTPVSQAAKLSSGPDCDTVSQVQSFSYIED